MASPSDLSLDCKPHSYSMLLKSFGEHSTAASHDRTQKLEEFLSRLEEERLKIDAFKRELPLCMQLLTNAVETSRQELQAHRSNQGPRLEEFIPLKNTTSEDKAVSSNDKANWMTTAQLWSQDSNINISNETKPRTITLLTCPNNKETDIGFNVSPKLALDTKQRNGGAFLPFSKERNLCPNPTLALASNNDHNKDMMEDKKLCSEYENGFSSCPRRESLSSGKTEHGKGSSGNSSSDHGQATNNTANANTNTATTTTNNTSTSQTHRKARRCWSHDLHGRFVNALHMLGGSQVATPKQIRELMKVDGLTNDEVKSHLQKYRLHTRRPSPSPQTAGAPAPPVVFLGGIWVPPDYATAVAAAQGGAPAAALYGAHPASHAPPPHFCTPPVPQDFYKTAAPPPPLPPSYPLHHHHHPLHVYKATSQDQSSPDSDMRGTGGDRSESIEDGKSESSSENIGGGERKGLAALREDGEESNGSEITLKF